MYISFLSDTFICSYLFIFLCTPSLVLRLFLLYPFFTHFNIYFKDPYSPLLLQTPFKPKVLVFLVYHWLHLKTKSMPFFDTLKDAWKQKRSFSYTFINKARRKKFLYTINLTLLRWSVIKGILKNDKIFKKLKINWRTETFYLSFGSPYSPLHRCMSNSARRRSRASLLSLRLPPATSP